MPNILVTLKEPIIAPDGKLYYAIWGEAGNTDNHSIKQMPANDIYLVGLCQIPTSNILGVISCEEKPIVSSNIYISE